jgi:signal transduction histidine kinase
MRSIVGLRMDDRPKFGVAAGGSDRASERELPSTAPSIDAMLRGPSERDAEFLSRMSHELRTPLNAILGFGQLLEADHELPATQRDNARRIVTAGRHLLGLID